METEPPVRPAPSLKVAPDEVSQGIDDFAAILDRLASKSQEFASLSTQQVLGLCREIIEILQTQEWSPSNSSWLKREVETCGLSNAAPHVVQGKMAEDKFVFCILVTTFLQTIQQGLEYEEGETTMPELLQKVRTVSIQDELQFSAFGPVALTRMPGHEFEFWTLPKKKGSSAREEEETKQADTENKPCVTVVLGAGNQPFLSMIDTLHCVFARREVVLLKHHPLRPHLMDPYAAVLEPLIGRGYVYQVLDQGIPKTVVILSHPRIGHVHMTGSLLVDKAVRHAMANARPLMDVEHMVTSELGCVTPWIVAPGTYSESELQHAAQLIVAAKKSNGGCNCLAAQAVVIPKDWVGKDHLKKVLLKELQRQPNHPCYYPGSRERSRTLQETYEASRSKPIVVEAPNIGGENNPNDNVVVVECGTPGEEGYDGTALMVEAFGPVLALVELPGNQETYLEGVAVPFVNDKESIYGSLSCSLLAPKDCDWESVDRAVALLRYGTVAINTWSLVGYTGALKGAIWGAYPDDTTRQSGNGVIGNFFGISDPGKTVVRGPALETKPLFDLAPKTPP